MQPLAAGPSASLSRPPGRCPEEPAVARASEQGQPCPGKEGSGGSCSWDGTLG